MKIIQKAYKFRFYPNQELISFLAQSFGCDRFIYNKILDINQKLYENENIKLSNNDRLNLITELKKEYTWLDFPSSIVLQQSVRHLNDSYSRFFKGQSGYPQFKKKFNRNSFTITGKNSIHFETVKIDDEKNNTNKEKLQFFLPKFKQALNIKFSRKFDPTKVSSLTVSKEPSGKYYISFFVEESIQPMDLANYEKIDKTKINNETIITKEIIKVNNKKSLDLGLESTVTTYDGQAHNKINLPKELIQSINKKIVLACKNLSRKKLGSRNRNKAKIKLAKLYEYRTNIINDFYHKLSHDLVQNNRMIYMEDLNINQMKAKAKKIKPTIKNLLNPDFNKHVIDKNNTENKAKPKSRKNNYSKLIQVVAWGKLKNCLEYKSDWHDRTLIKADQFYPSSKKCSTPGCAFIHKNLDTKVREWTCPDCHVKHDRDENASVNIFNYQPSMNNVNSIKKVNPKLNKGINKETEIKAKFKEDLNKNQTLNQEIVVKENNGSNVKFSRNSKRIIVKDLLLSYAKLNRAVGATVQACEESKLTFSNRIKLDSTKQESSSFRAR